MRRSYLLGIVPVLLLVACGGGGGGAITPSAKATPVANLAVSVTAPAPQVQSMTFAFLASDGSIAASQTVGVTPASSGCSTSAPGTSCAFTLSLQPGSYVAKITTYSGANGGGSVLSDNQRVAVVIGSGASNVLNVTMNDAPASIAVTPVGVPTSVPIGLASPSAVVATSNGAYVEGTQKSGYTISVGGMAAASFLANAADKSGNVIVGPNAPSFAITSSSPSLAVAAPAKTAPNTFTLTPAQSLANLSSSIGIASTPGGAGTTFAMNYAPYAADDWITFARDFRRTARETQLAAPLASGKLQFKLRWSARLATTVMENPVVYDGNVLVADYGGDVADFSAVDGHVIWEESLQTSPNDSVIDSPTVDVADHLVFVGIRTFDYAAGTQPPMNSYPPEPSRFVALDLATGAVAWTQTLPGPIRADPVVANGMVYTGISGGDPPYCLNGGIVAMDAKSGAIAWRWYVNQETNPGGGGSVWGAIAYDGANLVFGTGNTCQQAIPDSQGAVSLNAATGAENWAYSAEADENLDDDTGGSVLLQSASGGMTTATFMSKNGTLYTLNAATGAKLASFALAPAGLGGHGAPSSDGAITIIAGSAYPASGGQTVDTESLCRIGKPLSVYAHPDASLTSQTNAVDANGNVLWKISNGNYMNNAVTTFGEIALVDTLNQFVFVDIPSGTTLATLPTDAAESYIAGAAVVPSGVYVAASDGTVSAYSIASTP